MPDAKPPRTGEAFSWPPGKPEPSRPVAPSTTPGETSKPLGPLPSPWRIARVRGWLHACEEVWLDRTAAPLAWREALGELISDAPGAYCPRCGTSAGPFEADADGCRECRNTRLPWSRAVRVGAYEGGLRECIHQAKFGGWRRLQTELGRRLGRALAQALESERVPGPYWIVPVPTTVARRLERGMDHTLVLARAVAREVGGRVVVPLKRVKPAAQTGASATERARLASGAFRPRDWWWTGWRRAGLAWGERGWGKLGRGVVIVVDDVRTTGATLRAACRGVAMGSRRAGSRRPKVWVATVGVTGKGEAR